jgi:hypothetical protein
VPAVDGLDLAAGLGRGRGTAAAARVLAGLLLPAGTTAQMLLDETGWDQITMIAKATRRIPLTVAEATLIQRHGIRRPALGGAALSALSASVNGRRLPGRGGEDSCGPLHDLGILV